MAKVTMLNMAGAEAGKIELNDAIFAITPNEFAVHAVVKNYLAIRDRAHSPQRPEAKSEEADASLSDRKVPVATDRDIQLTLHRSVAVSYLLQSQETIDTHFLRS